MARLVVAGPRVVVRGYRASYVGSTLGLQISQQKRLGQKRGFRLCRAAQRTFCPPWLQQSHVHCSIAGRAIKVSQGARLLVLPGVVGIGCLTGQGRGGPILASPAVASGKRDARRRPQSSLSPARSASLAVPVPSSCFRYHGHDGAGGRGAWMPQGAFFGGAPLLSSPLLWLFVPAQLTGPEPL
ncbi:hypothetical protein BS50DRAFT_197228 [Corynespora cassiicola Philippines]|uniref:Uncharacterized protein n=1 Tax=Corynespora cassiicola Philippines TaxID=1448308 RepID=A0A2T2N5K7_CORCC|nr:hypothetical protein BS50DRAFT_197228 [Corynespora cassiicola Philippines]